MPRPRLHADQVHVDEALVATLIRQAFPDASGQPLREVDSAGTVNAIYRLGSELAVRLPLMAAWADVAEEAAALAYLRGRLPLEVPEVVAVIEPSEQFPLPWSVVRWIEGEPWAVDRLADPTGAAIQIAEFLEALGALDAKQYPDTRNAHWCDLSRRSDAVRSFIDDLSDRFPPDAMKTMWEAALAVPAWSGPPQWVHGDLMPGNLLVRNGQPVAVIDWAARGHIDPARDLAAVWGLFDAPGRSAFRTAMDADEEMWIRARGWTVSSLGGIRYYEETNPEFARVAEATIHALLEDP